MTTQTLRPELLEQVLIATAAGSLPEVHWLQGDDLCDCVFQRIGEWTNPYLGKTLRVRLCCIWAEIYKQYPQFVQDIDASYDVNNHAWVTEPREWDLVLQPDDGPDVHGDMPLPIWYRQLARKTGKTLSEIRLEYAHRSHERPKARHWTKGMTWKQPTQAQLKQAKEAQLRATGWIIPAQHSTS